MDDDVRYHITLLSFVIHPLPPSIAHRVGSTPLDHRIGHWMNAQLFPKYQSSCVERVFWRVGSN